MESLKIDRTKLVTQAEYAKMKGVSRAYINAEIKRKNIKTVEIKGATLVLLP
tara:strand:- start:3337 stop:3492 length:156 start_codon:yes stop_codon:yes gene_type:complete